jgi:hypothetical protein
MSRALRPRLVAFVAATLTGPSQELVRTDGGSARPTGLRAASLATASSRRSGPLLLAGSVSRR